jgi:hypothetical protein
MDRPPSEYRNFVSNIITLKSQDIPCSSQPFTDYVEISLKQTGAYGVD